MKILTILTLCLSLFSYSKEKVQGLIFDKKERTPVENTLIVLTINNLKYNAITNKDGSYKILLDKNLISDTLYFSIYKKGYKKREKILDFYNPRGNYFLIEKEENIDKLDEVVLTEDKNIIEKSNKTVHLINSKKFTANTSISVAMRTFPNLNYTGNKFMINNRKNVIFFMDGMQVLPHEVETIEVKDVEKVEVIPNPSADYGDEFKGGIVNIIKKEKNKNFYKGIINASKGARLNSNAIYPSISFKNKYITLNTMFSYNTYIDEINSDIERYNHKNNYNFKQNHENKNLVNMYTFVSRLKIDLTSKSNLRFNFIITDYSFRGDIKGEVNNLSYTSKTKDVLRQYGFNSGYIYKFSKKENFVLAYSYFIKNNKNNNLYTQDTNIINTNILSKVQSNSVLGRYKNKVNLIFPISITTGYKGNFRNFIFDNALLNLDQNVNALYFNSDISFNNNLSSYVSLYYANTDTKNDNYGNFLPNISLQYKLNNNTNFKLNYNKKIKRPSPTYLNFNQNFENPGYISEGNYNLSPQITDNIELDINQKIFKKNFNINFYLKEYKDMIVQTFIQRNNNIIYFYDNVGYASKKGGSIGFNGKLFNFITYNTTNGIVYNYYKSNSNSILINFNEGWSFNSSLNLYTKIYKKTAINLSFFYNSNRYDLIETVTERPLINLSVNRNFFENKLNIEFSYNDMFAINSLTKNNINNGNFSQNSTVTNNRSNFTIRLKYLFGDTFNDMFGVPSAGQ